MLVCDSFFVRRSSKNKMFLPVVVFGYTIALGSAMVAILYVDARLYEGPWLKSALGVKQPDDDKKERSTMMKNHNN